MGCTSSAQNMPPSMTSSVSENDLKDTEATIEKAMVEKSGMINEKGNESNGIQVLPTCDTLGESAHLDRNNKSLIDMTNPDLDKDNPNPPNGIVDENDNRNKHETTNNLNGDKTVVAPTEEKLSTLEEVVEKVVEMYVENPVESKTSTTEEPSNKEEPPKQEIEQKEEETKTKQEDTEAMEEEVAEEAASPSQSQSSRATRWEALADIAAELPPSLAVDPITGQIYSLSK